MRVQFTLPLLLLVGCSPGPIDNQPDLAEQARAACSSFCTVRHQCGEPTETIAECQDQCMELPQIADDSECGAAWRGLQECIGELSCDGYAMTLAVPPSAETDPCFEAKLAFESVTCGEGQP